MALYVVKADDRTNPLGEVSEDRLKAFGEWLTGLWSEIKRARTQSEEWGRTYKDPEHMRTVHAWHALNGTVLSWGNAKHPRSNGTDPQREFQITMIANVIGSYGALRLARSMELDEDTMTRLTTDYNTAVMVLAQYSNITGPGLDLKGRTELIRAAGENQDKVILAALTL